MLTKLLSQEDKKNFLLFAELLSIADKPLLWDGVPGEAITPLTNMEKISIKTGEAEARLLMDWGWAEKAITLPFFGGQPATSIERNFLLLLKDIPHHDTEDTVERSNVVSAALRKLLKEKSLTNAYAIRIALYELMLLALVDGKVSPIEVRFLEEFSHHHGIRDLAFHEMLERAETMHRETHKTIALILE